jgi:hypothetical protein
MSRSSTRAYEVLDHTISLFAMMDSAAAGEGPTGWIMPNYISEDRDTAAKNGEDAIVDYLLLSVSFLTAVGIVNLTNHRPNQPRDI